MQTLQFQAVIDEKRILSLVLPSTVRLGKASVTVVLEEDEPRETVGVAKSAAEEAYEALLHFGDGRRLGGLSIKELVAEGRR